MKYYGIQFLESIGSRELAGVHVQNDNFVEGFAWRVAGWGLGPLGGDGCIGKFARLLGWLGPLWGAGWMGVPRPLSCPLTTLSMP